MQRLAYLILAAFLFAVPTPSTRAGVDPTEAPIAVKDYELVVMEADGCIYCRLFRRDVLPAFEASEQGRQMTVRFLDINNLESSKLELQSAVDIVPTFVVVRQGKEIGRIPGYVGPENFFHSIDYLLAAAP